MKIEKVKERKVRGFTLIELIAVLVIMAIIALIVTPLVMNIIRKARIAADKRSVDAYGRSIELAIAGYLLDTGKFPTEVSQLTIEYTGDTVSCETTQINTDSSVYLAGCTVKNRTVEGYTYGNDKSPSYKVYNVGDEITYKGMKFYVVSASGAKESSVTALKETPLTVDEVTTYGAGHINRYTTSSQGVAYNSNGYGGMTYYSSDTCKSGTETGCTSDYDDSDIKYAVDAWANDKLVQADLKADSLGYKARLLTFEEFHSLGYGDEPQSPCGPSCGVLYYPKTDNVPEWLYNSNYAYWAMAADDTNARRVWCISNLGYVYANSVWNFYISVVRPVVTFSKSAL